MNPAPEPGPGRRAGATRGGEAAPPRPPWWRGTRGEWYVAGQVALMLLVFLGPRTAPGLPPWPPALARAATWLGAALLLAGGSLFLAGIVGLGANNLTPLPRPRESGTLVQTGPYAIVRHPLYSGGLGLAFGYALMVHGWLTLAWAAAILVFLEVKSAREERWLAEKFPVYRAYQRRVRKLIPFVH